MSLDPQRTAFLFPGQGSQVVGMGRELAASSAAAASVFAQADEALGYRLSALCWDGPAERLNETEHTQPALLTHSTAALAALTDTLPNFQPAFAAGHSLGEFSALVCAGSLTFPEALRLVRERALAMKGAGESAPGGMSAVLGLEAGEVEEACREASARVDGGVWVANDNCPGQVVISGNEDALAEATPLLESRGARKVIRLAVSIAAHSPLMQPAQDLFSRVLAGAALLAPSVLVVGNVSASPLRSEADVADDLRAQLTANVRWTESVRFMLAEGVSTFVEIGSGAVLTGLLRRIDRAATGLNLDGPASLEQLAA